MDDEKKPADILKFTKKLDIKPPEPNKEEMWAQVRINKELRVIELTLKDGAIALTPQRTLELCVLLTSAIKAIREMDGL